eukprot:2764082-Prymnesium_polylepis.1
MCLVCWVGRRVADAEGVRMEVPGCGGALLAPEAFRDFHGAEERHGCEHEHSDGRYEPRTNRTEYGRDWLQAAHEVEVASPRTPPRVARCAEHVRRPDEELGDAEQRAWEEQPRPQRRITRVRLPEIRASWCECTSPRIADERRQHV